MIFPSLELARRLEAHDLWNAQEHVRTMSRLYPETAAETRLIGGGLAVFAGVKSPLSGLYGLGLWEPATAAHLDEAEAFFRDRGLEAALEIQICPFADLSLARLLAERGYVIHDYMNTYAMQPQDLYFEPELPPGVDGELQLPPSPTGAVQLSSAVCLPTSAIMRIATEAEARRWYEVQGEGGDWAEPDGISFMLVRAVQKTDTHLYMVWMDGQPVSAGALEIHDGVASLFAAATLPEYRGRGLQTALLQARLVTAKNAGCDLALVHSRPGTASQRNILRAGFQLVYTNIDLRKANP